MISQKLLSQGAAEGSRASSLQLPCKCSDRFAIVQVCYIRMNCALICRWSETAYMYFAIFVVVSLGWTSLLETCHSVADFCKSDVALLA